jgi:hypothetical protein
MTMGIANNSRSNYISILNSGLVEISAKPLRFSALNSHQFPLTQQHLLLIGNLPLISTMAGVIRIAKTTCHVVYFSLFRSVTSKKRNKIHLL